MKKLIIGDIHFIEYYQIFQKILFKFLIQILDKYEINEVIILGDVFDTSYINNTTSLLFKNLLKIFKGLDIKIILGNHEKIDMVNSIYDPIIYTDDVTIYKDLNFDNNCIYLPHIIKNIDLALSIDKIKKYISKTVFSEYYIYSHNDFKETYKFTNNFISATDAFAGVTKTVYLINGHNHVPFFKKANNINILNIGNAINLSFKDTGLYNIFLLIDNEKENISDKIKVLRNKNSIQYYTFDIDVEDDILKCLNSIVNDNIKYVNFKITSPNITISNEDRIKYEEEYSINSINIEYNIKVREYDQLSLTNDKIKENETIEDVLKNININIDEFLEENTIDDLEKFEILYTLLDALFLERHTEEKNRIEVLETIKKYFIKKSNVKK